MKVLRFDGLLQKKGWMSPAYIRINAAGQIISISAHGPTNVDEIVPVWALPTVTNAHSHAFQYAMPLLAEDSKFAATDFWHWRHAMYALANKINPDQLECVAKRVYAEMLRVGYGWVIEFHYLHHDHKGQAYCNPAEMSERLIHAATEVGMGITLVPVFYKNSNFHTQALQAQRRFIFDGLDSYLKLLEGLTTRTSGLAKVKIGCGVHSMRAADMSDIIYLMNQQQGPKHLHIAEQAKEVDDCLTALGARPVQWLCEHVNVNESINLIHAIHINSSELNQLLSAKANVVLCPSTEAYLGDGLFPLSLYVLGHGRWCIGSDSHIRLNPFEELRWLDYCQRLVHEHCIPFCNTQTMYPVAYAFEQVISNGRLAAGIKTDDYFAQDQALDCLVFSSTSCLLDTINLEHLLSTLIYRSDCHDLLGTLISGQWQITNQNHPDTEHIESAFKKTMLELR